MLSLTHIKDETLLKETAELAQRERELTLEILHHLMEIERRRLFSTLGCSSLFTYCTEKLGYSEGAAQRRIQAMRALRDMPAIETKIEAGSLTLSNLAQAQTFFSHQKKSGHAYSPAKKLDLLGRLERMSAREAEKVIACENPSLAGSRSEKVRVLDENQSELKIVVDDEFLNLIEKLKGRIAHKYIHATAAELLKYALQKTLEQLDPGAGAGLDVVAESGDSLALAATIASPPPTSAVKVSKSISATSRRAVWSRAGGKCEKCQSIFALQIDHRKPKALGGDNELENLRLLCRHCNQRAAIEQLGLKKMISYFNRSRRSIR